MGVAKSVVGKLGNIWEFPKIVGPQYRPQNTIVLIIGTAKMVPLILGNPHMVDSEVVEATKSKAFTPWGSAGYNSGTCSSNVDA